METFREEHIWRITVSHEDATNLTDYDAKKSHSYVIFIASRQMLVEGIYSTLYTLNFQNMWNSKANSLVVITDHVKDSSEGIAKNVLEELWLMSRVLNALFVITGLDTSLSL